jgi:glycosyltransferase involved in cell wall biosynthesis
VKHKLDGLNFLSGEDCKNRFQTSLGSNRQKRTSSTQYPLVSIIIPGHNYGQYLADAIESALRQTYPNVEIIVVNDGSTDNTDDVVKRYPVKLLVQEYLGVAAARNNGIKHSSGHFFLCLDGDDKICPKHIEKTIEKMTKNLNIGFVTTGSKIWYAQTKFENISMPRKIRFRYTVFAGWVAALGTVLMRKVAFESLCEGYDPTLPAHEDLDLCFRLLKNWKSEVVFEPLHWYRRHTTFLDSQTIEKRRIAGMYLDRKYPFRRLYRMTYMFYKSTLGRIVSIMSHPIEYFKALREKTMLRVQLNQANPKNQLEAKEYIQQIYATLDMQVEWSQSRELHNYYEGRKRILRSGLQALFKKSTKEKK